MTSREQLATALVSLNSYDTAAYDDILPFMRDVSPYEGIRRALEIANTFKNSEYEDFVRNGKWIRQFSKDDGKQINFVIMDASPENAHPSDKQLIEIAKILNQLGVISNDNKEVSLRTVDGVLSELGVIYNIPAVTQEATTKVDNSEAADKQKLQEVRRELRDVQNEEQAAEPEAEQDIESEAKLKRPLHGRLPRKDETRLQGEKNIAVKIISKYIDTLKDAWKDKKTAKLGVLLSVPGNLAFSTLIFALGDSVISSAVLALETSAGLTAILAAFGLFYEKVLLKDNN